MRPRTRVRDPKLGKGGDRRALLSLHARDHPIAMWLSVGAIFVGLLLLLSPTTTRADSTTLSILPIWGVLAWGSIYCAGGVMALIGLTYDDPRWESAGMALLGSAFVAATIAQLTGEARVTSMVFIGTLAIGTLHRAVILTRS